MICLDVLRALTRATDARNAFVAELERGLRHAPLFDIAIDKVKTALLKPQEEAGARRLVEKMALALQGTVLADTAPDFVTDAFCKTRLCDEPGLAYGAVPEAIAIDALISRAMPS